MHNLIIFYSRITFHFSLYALNRIEATYKYFARRTTEGSDDKKRAIPKVRVHFIYRRASSIQIQHFSRRKTVSAIILLTSINMTFGRQIFAGDAITETQKIRAGTASLHRFGKDSLCRRSYSNYFQRCLLGAKSCPYHYPSATAGAVVSVTRSHTAAKHYRRSSSCFPVIKCQIFHQIIRMPVKHPSDLC